MSPESSSKSGPVAALEQDAHDSGDRPLVSLVLPAYNEADILEHNLVVLRDYMLGLEHRYRWEMIVVNDGSADATAQIADAFAAGQDNVRVLHHPRNGGLGRAFQTAFAACRGDYVVTLDVDLSYSPDHIERLLDKIVTTHSALVLASPYMKGGRISNVPWLRRTMSIWANRFLSLFSQGNLSTLTCMVRAYDARFLRGTTLRGTGMEIMPETVYKTMVLRGNIEQIPAHLDWGPQNATQRTSSMRMLSHIVGTLLSGFIFRPFMFFIVPGLVLLVFAVYVNVWMVIHFFEAYFALPEQIATDPVSAAIAAAYAQYPHTFIVGLLSLMLAVQLVSLGILALQNKNYFEEIFNLGTSFKSPPDDGQRMSGEQTNRKQP